MNYIFPHFSVASSKFCGKWRIPWHGVKIRVLRNTAGPDDHHNHCVSSSHVKC